MKISRLNNSTTASPVHTADIGHKSVLGCHQYFLRDDAFLKWLLSQLQNIIAVFWPVPNTAWSLGYDVNNMCTLVTGHLATVSQIFKSCNLYIIKSTLHYNHYSVLEVFFNLRHLKLNFFYITFFPITLHQARQG